MKIILLATFFLPLVATAQSIVEWNEKTDSLILTLQSAGDQMTFANVLDRRRDIDFLELSDTSIHFVMIEEMFNVFTDESYEYVDTFRNEEDVSNANWKYSAIDSVKPRPYYLYFGCVPTPHLLAKAKRWERKIAKMDPVKESVYVIDTFWDKKNHTIKVSLRVPFTAKRALKVFFGDGGRDRKPKLYKWDY